MFTQDLEDIGCSEDPDVKGTETILVSLPNIPSKCCSEDPDVKGTETISCKGCLKNEKVAARIPM